MFCNLKIFFRDELSRVFISLKKGSAGVEIFASN